MALNCKKGDLAIRIRARKDSRIPIGAIVRVIQKSNAETFGGRNSTMSTKGLHLWSVEYQDRFTNPETGNEWGIPDDELKPIRPSTRKDEALTWAPVPDKVTA